MKTKLWAGSALCVVLSSTPAAAQPPQPTATQPTKTAPDGSSAEDDDVYGEDESTPKKPPQPASPGPSKVQHPGPPAGASTASSPPPKAGPPWQGLPPVPHAPPNILPPPLGTANSPPLFDTPIIGSIWGYLYPFSVFFEVGIYGVIAELAHWNEQIRCR